MLINKDIDAISEEMQQQMRLSEELYGDILEREHPVSVKYKPMSLHDRAAQFSPFAAMTGYDSAIRTAEENFAKTEQDQLKHDKWTEDRMDAIE